MPGRSRTVIALVVLVGFAGATGLLAQDSWRLQVHHDGAVDEYDVAAIDSITFVPVEFTPPPLVAVPAGSFAMGGYDGYCGFNTHQVTLTRGILVGQHEVTNQEFLDGLRWAFARGHVAVVDGQVRDTLDGSDEVLLDLDDADCEIAFADGGFVLRDAGWGVNPQHPVVEVRWFGAVCFCDWSSLRDGLPRAYLHVGDWPCNGGDPYGAAGFRLLTDAEWEYVARYPDGRPYPWGGQDPACALANFAPADGPCVGWTTIAGAYPAGQSFLGLADLAGNVFEWCNDWHECDLGWAAQVDPRGPADGSRRVLRGGGWVCQALNVRSTSRDCFAPAGAANHAGFRIARTGR
ncbi:MAG TPA: SUMF1/EgtB/PvdO family nonheme iron enzyme [Candidatus Krumholzibacteria bacterium]|nr:SUMF1/EgtB/PvdO family nonheme iron enzyme [Candidatus Krumholzibacteria bacterium]HPD72274.1 SUMF1/EgtB/PvdO family nonheme iron enzyme [Candidatus Krumholzibacteria bacterium]HRY40794.1 SUMF1/EgtB/PvdO family nonheme iron enzyme [Candidatus Krumholzibacteria bacterium]